MRRHLTVCWSCFDGEAATENLGEFEGSKAPLRVVERAPCCAVWDYGSLEGEGRPVQALVTPES